MLVTFWCRECWPEKEWKPLRGIEAELMLNCLLLQSRRNSPLSMDEPERREIYANTLKPLTHDEDQIRNHTRHETEMPQRGL